MLGGGCHPGLVYAEDRATTRVQLEKSGPKLVKNRLNNGPKIPIEGQPTGADQCCRRHPTHTALHTLGRWFTHPHFKLHACQHLKSRKVHKPVKWDPTKGPTGQKWTKIYQNRPKLRKGYPKNKQNWRIHSKLK
jgi:hypothetical protein